MLSFISSISEAFKGSKVGGINIRIGSDKDFVTHVVILKKTLKGVSAIKTEHLASVNEIPDHVQRNIPLYLSIDGKGVLHKLVDEDKREAQSGFILPDTDARDFVIQETILTDKKKILSVIRKDMLVGIISSLNDLGFCVPGTFLGPFSVSAIIPHLNGNSVLSLPDYNLLIKDGQISGFEKLNSAGSDLEIDSETLTASFIVPFSNCIYHFSNLVSPYLDYPLIEQKERFYYEKLFNLSGWSIILFLFFSLLLNFTLYDFYNKKNQVLSEELTSNIEILSKVNNLKSQVENSEMYYRNNPSSKNNLYSYYCDRIVKVIPDGITLSRLAVSPVEKQNPSQNNISFKTSLILISGLTKNSSLLDRFLTGLKSYKWIDNISIKNYIDTGDGPARFDLEVKLHKS
jgi:hypothetical protein